MRVVVISPQIYPHISEGVEIFNYHLIKELASQGHKIWVFTCHDHNWNNRNIHHVKLWSGLPGLTTLSITFSIILNLIRLKCKIDLVHVPYTSNSYLAYPVLLVKKLSCIPYFITIHGGGMYEWKPKKPHQLFFKYAKTIIAVSESVRKEYEKRSGIKIKLIPPLIPFEESKLSKNELRKIHGFNDNDTVVLYLGSIKKIKGSDILLNAFLNFETDYIKRNSLKLLYVGNGPMRPILETKVDEKNFSQYVKFFGSILHEKVPEMYRLADIYVMPSLFEGTPMALLEAMFNGLPIIGTNVNGINNLIEHKKNGLLFAKANIGNLKEKIIELVEDENLSKRLGNAAKRDYKDCYKFDDVISGYIKIMEEILEI